MDAFECVRAVQFWGVDLAQFQMDFDQTWAVFLMNADGTVYGRYGSRSSFDCREDTVPGLKKALARALELHAEYPKNKKELDGKRAPKQPVPSADRFPAFNGRWPTSAVGRNCVHCHNTTEGYRTEIRRAKKPLPDESLYPYPLPDVLGLHLDTAECATVAKVDAGSAAAKGGFRDGDRIVSVEGQPPLSIADVQWVLHHAKAPSTMDFEVARADGSAAKTSLVLTPGWRRYDFLWRPSTNPLQPGFGMDDATQVERTAIGVATDALALRVRGVWKNGPAAGSGLAAGDFVIGVDGRTDIRTKLEFIVYVQQERVSGDTLQLTVAGKKRKKVEIKIP